jgi:SAM-dependent methyltransferase
MRSRAKRPVDGDEDEDAGMLRYAVMVAASRFFSLSPQTLTLYRMLGNRLLERERVREGLPTRYIERAARLIQECRRHQAIPRDGRVLEVGTGWLHWEATIIRLLYDVELTLFDVWDNRLWSGFKTYVRELDKVLEQALDLSEVENQRAHRLLGALSRAESFDEVYRLLGAEYVINPAGTLADFDDERFDAVVSCDVLEHVDKAILPQFVYDMHRVLKPSGFSLHQIDLSDHFWYFDPKASRKNYYKYSDRQWRLFFENRVQYFNRVQRPEWLQLFRQAGFELVEEELTFESLSSLTLDEKYASLSRQDLECVTMRLVHRRRG